MKGWIYVGSMSMRKHVLKIGYSDKDPEARIKEWSNRNNGLFAIEAAALVDDPGSVQEEIWHALSEFAVETGSSQENLFRPQGLFDCDLETCVDAILDVDYSEIIWTKGLNEYIVEYTIHSVDQDLDGPGADSFPCSTRVKAISREHAFKIALLHADHEALIEDKIRNYPYWHRIISAYIAEDIYVFDSGTYNEAQKVQEQEKLKKLDIALNADVHEPAPERASAQIASPGYAGSYTLNVSYGAPKVLPYSVFQLSDLDSYDAEKYVGEYKDNKKHGQGAQTLAGGEKYVGDYKDGKPHGEGTCTWPDGSWYFGEFKGGKVHGQGAYTFATGSQYAGDYKDGKQHGQGTLTWTDGSKYCGGWKEDKRHGQGTYTWADGDKYVGEWKDGTQWEGTQYNKDGNVAATYSDGVRKPVN